MACITLFAQPMAMATTQLVRVLHYEHASTSHLEGTVERKPLSMSWVVVTDTDDGRTLRMQWTPSADLR
jgi:hypothetical protein